MKKSLSLLTAISLMLSLCSCENNIPKEPSLATNTGTSMFNQIMETEDGYYYNEAMAFNELSLRFYDKATGKDLFLCAKPECTHDGNSFCAATAGKLKTCYTAMYGDGIYITVLDRKEERTEYKLLKASLDGTELTEICTFLNVNNAEENPVIMMSTSNNMVIHRGYAFVPYFISTSESGMMGKTGAAVIDIQSGKYELISELDMSETLGIENITADGDCFYYTAYFSNTRENRFYSYNFKTKEEKEIPEISKISNYEIDSYTPVDGKLWFVANTDGMMTNDVYIYDSKTNTTEKSEVFTQKLGELTEIYDTEGNLQTVNFDIYTLAKLRYDGEYLYVAERGFFGRDYNEWEMQLHIFTLDGEELGSFIYEREGACQMNIVNSTVYIQTTGGVEYCAVSDIIDGKTEWKKLYSFEQNEVE